MDGEEKPTDDLVPPQDIQSLVYAMYAYGSSMLTVSPHKTRLPLLDIGFREISYPSIFINFSAHTRHGQGESFQCFG